MATAVTSRTVVSYTAFPPLPLKTVAVYFCCTGLGVTSTGRYPASCPVKPGLSSPAVFRHLQPRSFVLLNRILIMPSFVRKCKGNLYLLVKTIVSKIILFIFLIEFSDDFAGSSIRNHIRRNISGHNTAGANDTIISYRDTG